MYNMLTEVDTTDLTPEQTAVANETALMQPVQCVDCGQYVPLGWVMFSVVTCDKNVGASGVVYGHRAPTHIVKHVIDLAVNGVRA